MNLKTKLMVHAKIEEDVADHIVKGLTLSQQKKLCLLSADDLIKEIPELMRDANCLDEFEMDPGYQDKKVEPPINDLLGNQQILKPQAPSPKPEKRLKEINWRYLSYLLILSCCFLTYKLSTADQESTEEQLKIALKQLALAKKEPPPIIPSLPPRGAWMLTPNESLKSKVISLNKDIFKMQGDYTLELWIKKLSNNSSEINLLEMKLNNKIIERLYLNEKNQICFSAGPDAPLLTHSTPIPANGNHYHILISKSKDSYHLFINGKLKKKKQFKVNFLNHRDGIQLFRSTEAESGIAIDEIRLSKGAQFTQNFTPHRTFFISTTTVFYMPIEKSLDNKLRFYGVNHYSESEKITEGSWLNIIHETQEISNYLEKLRKSKK